ncbi:MAG: dTDP-glucose 4,6-dehydratase [Actinomycetia bacterium]|nr:dTDP-glucose 4,6-dehydratase [Actinomycetes bacterium]
MASQLLITGAAGFIGANLVYRLLLMTDYSIVVLDALTYSGHLESLTSAMDNERLEFVHADIRDAGAVRSVFDRFQPDGVIHLAAESHVDRSIESPMEFVTTNVQGTAVLLSEAERAWSGDTSKRFHHVSTDEVFGTLGPTGRFSEETPYSPRSPYAASKASSDHFVRAWAETYGLNVVITNCTNNYGPYQFPEKLIPVVIDRLQRREQIPIYGDGSNVRDWLYVEDHCDALIEVFNRGAPGETYCIGGETEMSNLDLVEALCDIYDEVSGRDVGSSRGLIDFVTDRPGHDFRYAMDITKIRDDLGWSPSVDIFTGLRSTVGWYLGNQSWVDAVQSDEHDTFQGRWYTR